MNTSSYDSHSYVIYFTKKYNYKYRNPLLYKGDNYSDHVTTICNVPLIA